MKELGNIARVNINLVVNERASGLSLKLNETLIASPRWYLSMWRTMLRMGYRMVRLTIHLKVRY